jgi:hypothetical protein
MRISWGEDCKPRNFTTPEFRKGTSDLFVIPAVFNSRWNDELDEIQNCSEVLKGAIHCTLFFMGHQECRA